jgi:hypothetical protein
MMHGSMPGSRDRSSRLWIGVFGAPVLLAVLTVAGLLAALLWGEVGRYVAWMTVGSPVLVILWVWLRRNTKKRRNSRRVRAET